MDGDLLGLSCGSSGDDLGDLPKSGLRRLLHKKCVVVSGSCVNHIEAVTTVAIIKEGSVLCGSRPHGIRAVELMRIRFACGDQSDFLAKPPLGNSLKRSLGDFTTKLWPVIVVLSRILDVLGYRGALLGVEEKVSIVRSRQWLCCHVSAGRAGATRGDGFAVCVFHKFCTRVGVLVRPCGAFRLVLRHSSG